MDNKKNNEYKEIAKNVREHIITISNNGGAFIGSALSCSDLIVFLYKDFLNVSKDNLLSKSRDYFFLSKGHAVPALYGTFIELGWLEKERLNNHLQVNDDIYWHPNTKIPGVEFHSGSLGHSLAIAVGIAIDCKIKESKNKIVVLVGDGELNEGSIWEALMVANAYKLDNLLIIIDRNQIQANLLTEELIPLDPLNLKFESFGCSVKSIDGHSFNDMHDTFRGFPFEKNRPSVIIADTVRGKGIRSIENKINKWFVENNDYDTIQYINELNVTNEFELNMSN
ncbi:MAG: 1-deoxy-D-xylulose-5-phosphate synthase N-terminal domain-containing protein [Melioribacteraceae bacterium]